MKAIMPKYIARGVGVTIRGVMPEVCSVCDEPDAFAIDYKAREVPNAIAYVCKKCRAIEYVSASAPVIVA